MSRTLDEAFRTLANRERRQLLLAPLEHDPQTDGPFVHPGGVPATDNEEQEKLHIRLHRVHLPMLEQAGCIERHRERRQVVKGPNFEGFRPLLAVLRPDTARAGQ